MPTFTFNSATGSYTLPAGYIPGTLVIQAAAESGNGWAGVAVHKGGWGGGGGGWSQDTPSAAAGTVISWTIGQGGSGTATVVLTPGSTTVTANYGANATVSAAGPGGAASGNAVSYAGGNGGNGLEGSSGTGGGGGGGGSAGASGAGGTGGNGASSSGGAGGTAGAGSPAGNAGGAGSGGVGTPGANGTGPGAGGGGGCGGTSGTSAGGLGQPGYVTISYQVATGYAVATGTVSGAKHASGSGGGYARAAGTVSGHKIASGPARGYARAVPVTTPPPTVVNEWSGTFTQPAAWGNTPPVLSNVMVDLNLSDSVGGGSGTPSAGNWLWCVAGWTQQAGTDPVTVAVWDDVHDWIRPAQTSPSSGLTRTAVWYTPNLERIPARVYVEPSGGMISLSVLVFEAQGPGPWDSLTGAESNYAPAAMSVGLALPAPSGPAFCVGAVCGDGGPGSGQSFAPSGWTPLSTVTAGSNVLTAAFLGATALGASVTGTATSDADLSGAIAGVLVSGPSPVTGSNPAFPETRYETALGAGFGTPPDELVWTDITKRVWAWKQGSTGVQYQLGQLESSEETVQFDNRDGAFSPSNPGSPFYSNALNNNMSFNMSSGWAGLLPASYPGVSSWTGANNAQTALSGTYAYASAEGVNAVYSMMVVPDGVTAAPGAATERVTVTAGDEYTGCGSFLVPGGWAGGAQVTVAWYNPGGSQISSTTATAVPVPASVTDWTQVTTVPLTAPSGAVTAQTTVQLAGTPAVPFWVAEAGIVPGAALVTGQIQTGTPVRARFALGTMGGVTYNRWYVWQRFAQSWPEQRTSGAWLGTVPAAATDIWSVASPSCYTPYRGEVASDSPYAWYPCDDQPLTGGVLPTSLRNTAAGNTNPLNISASPNGVAVQDCYSTGGADLSQPSSSAVPPASPSVAVYAVGADSGWMYGDPQGSPASGTGGGAVTSSPGAAAWQQSGLLGDTGSYGWYLSARDPDYPPLSAGVTIEKWFNCGFFGSSSGYGVVGSPTVGAAQPYCPLTICELATDSEPVAILQLDLSGHLQFISYSGSTPTSTAIYTASDLRNNAWNYVSLRTTTTAWTVDLNGGSSAGGVTVSGTVAGMTSAWTWLICAADFGSSGGSNPSGIQHGGNVSLSQIAVYPRVLPQERIWAHYCAAATGFGAIPPPSSLSVSTVNYVLGTANYSYTPDGSTYTGSFSSGNTFGLSALAVAQIGAYTSGPCARQTLGRVSFAASITYHYGCWAGWTSLAPQTLVYTSAEAGNETLAAVCCGSGDAWTSGYGSGAAGTGVCQVSGGTGASPPSSASALGDTVYERLARLLGYGGLTAPYRALDADATELCQAALDAGGQAVGSNMVNIQQSDDGLLFVDNLGCLMYRSRPHLAADAVTWNIGPGTGVTALPTQAWGNDPVRSFTDPRINPYSPDGTALPQVTPAAYALVQAQQKQIGARPLAVSSYLQSQAAQQSQADWLFAQYGNVRRRLEKFTADAASNPRAWACFLGANVSDIVQAGDVQPGAPATTGAYRLSRISRSLSYGADGAPVEAEITLTCDPIPQSYWS